ncbi:MAG: EcoKI restriction-modification system protein HsdS [Syntrophus sp. PtaU1.Bin208]|nr:MAG: EcoKI restriction-modification system protein HsdS [Syntrophus sp. PtaU1.Bin208]
MRFTALGAIVKEYGGIIQTGPFGSQLHQNDYTEHGIPVVMPKDIRGGRVDESCVARIPETKAQALSRHLLKVGSIVFPRRGEINKCAYIGEDQIGYLCGTGCLKIETPETILRSKFLYYYLGIGQVVKWLERNAVGTTMLNLNTKILGGISVPLLSLNTQDRIISILSAYDDLIENNRQRIQLLEQAARLLYKEWFVNLRFPGHEHVKIIDGVPEGWERKKIADVCETVGGGTPSTRVTEYWDGDITWVVPSDVTKNDCLVLLDSERKITEKGLRESSAKMVPAETILMTSRASVGYFALMDQAVCTNQGFINIIPYRNELRMYLLFHLMDRVNEIRSNAKGTTYPEISKGRFREMDVMIPLKPLVHEFGIFAGNIVQQVRCLKRSIQQLSNARDLLLPRLMNGEIAV